MLLLALRYSKQNFSIGGQNFFGNFTTGFFGKIFFRDTPQVILDLMTSVLSFDMCKGRANGRSHTHHKNILI
jgi:hypothetical protein